ncbi:MAG: phosphoribosyltransferase [Chloroflexi bacterium]|nr:phosphoribosyltransferase [Chloroflexota bacterium]
MAAHIATFLQAPFDVFLVRKLSPPNDPEVAFGAIASGGVRVLIPGMLRQLHLTPDVVEAITRQQQRLLNEREQRYRGEQAPPTLTGKVVLLADDGVATGATMRAAILAARQEGAETVIAAVPVGPADVIQQLRTIADSVVCPVEASEYTSVSQWYSDFRPVTDDEVVALLRHHESGTVL